MVRLGVTLALVGAVAIATQGPASSADAQFSSFFAARTPAEVSSASEAIVASGASAEQAAARLRQGRSYRPEVARGVVQGSYKSDAGEYFYTLDVPENYDPARKYQVRIQLHGGVGRMEESAARPAAAARLTGSEQIYVMPYAWRDAPWWSARQLDNLHTIVDTVKRTYNVDENRVVLSGVSDGGTGTYYVAMRDSTPFASFLPMNGFLMVLKNETAESDGDLFPHNLVNKPFFIVNGGRDPMYPTSTVDPYIARMKDAGVDLLYKPQPNAGHDTSWWPALKDEFEKFVTDHPRNPLPDRLSWEAGAPFVPARVHWLVIDRLAPSPGDVASLPDVNRMSTRPAPDFGIRSSGTRINRVVKGSNAEQVGLKGGDVVRTLNNQPIPDGADVAEMLRAFPTGRPVILGVSRGGESVRVTGRFAPTVLPGEAERMFPPQGPSGRVDVVRTGNRIDATARGVGAFTLLLSPDQFDLSKPVTVTVNGRPAFEGIVQKNVRTLLKWAARDNDRTMLFAAELPIEIR